MAKHKNITLMIALLAALALGSAGCNTTEGFGEDVEQLGQEIDEAAEDTGRTN